MHFKSLFIPWTYLYVALIPLVNWSFAQVPTLPLPDGGAFSPMAVVTGLILVVRDFAQREIGHWVAVPLVIGIGLSFVMAPAEIAWASAAAFAVGETVDWLIFTFYKAPLSKRVLASTFIAIPADTTIFWFIASFAVAGIFTWLTVAAAILSKWLGCYLVYLLLKRRELKKTRG